MAEGKLCPRCGKRTMVEVPLDNDKYTMICKDCGTQRGEFRKDIKKGVA